MSAISSMTCRLPCASAASWKNWISSFSRRRFLWTRLSPTHDWRPRRRSRWQCLNMMDRGGVSVVQPYMTTCGGLTEAKRIVELARARGALVCPGNWSTQILGAASVHLAAYSPITKFIEFAPAEVYDSPLRKELQ